MSVIKATGGATVCCNAMLLGGNIESDGSVGSLRVYGDEVWVNDTKLAIHFHKSIKARDGKLSIDGIPYDLGTHDATALCIGFSALTCIAVLAIIALVRWLL